MITCPPRLQVVFNNSYAKRQALSLRWAVRGYTPARGPGRVALVGVIRRADRVEAEGTLEEVLVRSEEMRDLWWGGVGAGGNRHRTRVQR